MFRVLTAPAEARRRSATAAFPPCAMITGTMAAHPTDPDVVYFVFGTYFQGYGSDIYRFDASSGTLTVNHNSAGDINAIAFSPRDPNLMYPGLESERGIH